MWQKIRVLYQDREYFSQLTHVAAPIALQNLLMSSLNMVSVILLGQLGEASVAAVGLAGQVFFLLNLVLFGIMSGSAMFTAQLWGRNDVTNIRRVLGLAIKLGELAALVFWALTMFAPEAVLRFYSTDPLVIAPGTRYLQIFGWSYLPFALTFAYSAVTRSTGNVRLPLVVSIAALILNTALAWALIFGELGLPKMGTDGAALAGLIARLFECGFLLTMIYRKPENPAAAPLSDLLSFDAAFAWRVLRPVLPVIANETLWSLGITTYNSIYAHVGTNAIAAMNIVSTIDQLAFVGFLGIGNATAILVGNVIGQGDKDKAFLYAGRSLGLQIAGALIMGALVALFGNLFFQLYRVSPAVIENAHQVLLIMAASMWIRATNMVIVVGILRSGGDTRFSLVLDGLVIWLVGVPLTAFGAFGLHLPIALVYLLAQAEELTKLIAGMWRYFSRRWMNDLTQTIEA
ncbi:MAG: MATE family efflux transporter [Anaerolineae bacterium CG_4_9_14_3_um_filter_57_17]|nr:MATE family efflux transporter [bacterium]NCT20102.1 MATE family efflux transporter [bacterium]OIO86995.1 MAG: hypothetical protein AUK01_01400 [Anaerolineae bacterium CG2_30_57_67]PJB64362.1 MAG: MATE family efflux transporter [Anaerolineae bacterium CG_4_9_14_3_um_filter_57_17]